MKPEDIIKQGECVYKKPALLNDVHMHYCPGCSHGVVHKLIAEVIEEMGMEDKAIGVSPVGCAVFAYNYLDIDWIQAAHGRAPSVATATTRKSPLWVTITRPLSLLLPALTRVTPPTPVPAATAIPLTRLPLWVMLWATGKSPRSPPV